jgi:hypothetical protein
MRFHFGEEDGAVSSNGAPTMAMYYGNIAVRGTRTRVLRKRGGQVTVHCHPHKNRTGQVRSSLYPTSTPMSSSSSSFITTPLSLEPEPRGVTVRFDDECILIPDPQPRSRMSRLLLKIRRPSQEPSSPTSPHHCHVPPSPRPA